MVVIRLARSGSKKRPFYNIVAADSRNRRDGRFIERIGYYNPVASGNAVSLVVNAERLSHWQGHGRSRLIPPARSSGFSRYSRVGADHSHPPQ